MNIVFSGLEHVITLEPGKVSVLEVHNGTLFSRFALSLLADCVLDAMEPYSLWEDDTELKSKDALFVISDPLNLPWDHRLLLGEITKKLERDYIEDEDLRLAISQAQEEINSRLLSLGMAFHSDYRFAAEWDFKKYLKTMGFQVDWRVDEPLVDRLISFLSLVLDAGCKKAIVFVNLKTFLSEKDLITLYEHIFYCKLPVLLLENKPDELKYKYEQKIVVDLQFLENRMC